MLHILWGPDDFSISQALEEMKEGIGNPSVLSANTTTLDDQQMTLDELKTVCGTLPFLAERRLVIVRGLLERFESRSKSSRQKKTVQLADLQNEWGSLSDYVGEMPDSTILVLIDGGITAGNHLLKQLSGKAKVRSFPRLKDAQLRQWLQQRVVQEGGSISPVAANLLVRMIGGNLWIMASELDKLVMFASGRRIDEEDVRTVVSYAQQANVFAMVDATLEFKAGIAGKSLQQLLQRGATPAYLLTMITRQVRLIVRAKEVRKQVKSKVEIQNKLGLTSEFVLHKTLEQADRYPLERIKDVYHRLLEADLSIKTGKYDSELALNILIAELCQQRKSL